MSHGQRTQAYEGLPSGDDSMEAFGLTLPDMVTSEPARGSILLGPRPLAPRIRLFLQTLREALEYSLDLKTSRWEFAVEWQALRRFGVTPSDLRWLAARGMIESGLEVTKLSSPERSFQSCQQLVISKRTCFVLTDAGEELLASGLLADGSRLVDADWPANESSAEDAAAVLRPHWDHDRLELRLGSTVLRQFKLPSADEERVLAAFEERGWPRRIGSPLPAGGDFRRLVECVAALNWRLRRPLLHFGCNEQGHEVTWEFRSGNGRTSGL
jgi:hypothetical protein